MILLDKRITKALISLRGCAGWSEPVLLANPQRQVLSRQGPYLICMCVFLETLNQCSRLKLYRRGHVSFKYCCTVLAQIFWG